MANSCQSRASFAPDWHKILGERRIAPLTWPQSPPKGRASSLRLANLAGSQHTSDGDRDEAHFSTFEPCSRPPPRVPCAYGHQRRPSCAGSAPRQGPQETVCLIFFKNAFAALFGVDKGARYATAEGIGYGRNHRLRQCLGGFALRACWHFHPNPARGFSACSIRAAYGYGQFSAASPPARR